MKTGNLIAAYQGAAAIEAAGIQVDRRFRTLKKHEIRSMESFCEQMLAGGCTIGNLDGFYVGYTIAQIGKEMDLLRFGRDYVLNIELKSVLHMAGKQKKILEQMRKNYYYLKFLGTGVRIFTYVEEDGFYRYSPQKDDLEPVGADQVCHCMKYQDVDESIDPDREFVPSNYLISPFNSTEAFLRDEYFLTTAQQQMKRRISQELEETPFRFFCLSANAGTGKTLLVYDMAKEAVRNGKKILVIHCGTLNPGQQLLNRVYHWTVRSIREIPTNKNRIDLSGLDMVFVDEAQRIWQHQLESLTEKAVEQQVPMLFSYDTKQNLRPGEPLELSDFLRERYPETLTTTMHLTNRIRTNKAMASFITNLLEIGKSTDHLDYENITVEYMEDLETVKVYLDFLREKGWTPITYTTSDVSPDSYRALAQLSDLSAHQVIGQEFPRVVLVMNENFCYGPDGALMARGSDYSARGMVYQIVTRVEDELKIIVVNNPPLYGKLLEIKAMGLP